MTSHTHRPCALLSFHTGQRLFQRSHAGSESFSESSSVGQAEDTASEGPIAQNIHPPTPPPALEEDSRSASDAVPQTMQESSVKMHTQVEAGAASDERQPEGQEVQDSGR